LRFYGRIIERKKKKLERKKKVRKLFNLKQDDFIDDGFLDDIINVENINKSAVFKVIRTKTDYGMNKNALNMFAKEKIVSFKECIKHYENHLKGETIRGLKEYGLTKINIVAKTRVYNEVQCKIRICMFIC
jgi:hypothetical protein